MDKLLFKLQQDGSYSGCLKTLQATSYDETNHEYLCNSTVSVYDFDCLTRILCPEKTPRSFDALLIIESCIYGIEFKNQSASNVEKDKLQEKLTDSQTTLKNLFDTLSISTQNYEFVFCVVYKKPKTTDYGRYKPYFKGTTHKFGLESKLKNLFKTNKVITNDIEFISKEFYKMIENKAR